MTLEADSWIARNHFMLRRLHSLTGIIPIGAFLIEHLLTNSLAFFGEKQFNIQVKWLHDLHYLIWLEVLFIFIPIAFHGLYGIVIALTARTNATRYPYADNWRFVFQRWTGIVTVLFIIVHLGHFRFAEWFGGTAYVHNENPYALTAGGFTNIAPGVIWYPIYLIGLATAVYHFCNGLVTFCITWGIAISVESRKRFTVLAAGVGALLMIWGVMSLYALATAKVPAASDELTPVENAAMVYQIPADPKAGS